jgi:hypothetical protein
MWVVRSEVNELIPLFVYQRNNARYRPVTQIHETLDVALQFCEYLCALRAWYMYSSCSFSRDKSVRGLSRCLFLDTQPFDGR